MKRRNDNQGLRTLDLLEALVHGQLVNLCMIRFQHESVARHTGRWRVVPSCVPSRLHGMGGHVPRKAPNCWRLLFDGRRTKQYRRRLPFHSKQRSESCGSAEANRMELAIHHLHRCQLAGTVECYGREQTYPIPNYRDSKNARS
jgi:hypothetical protein